MRVTPVRGLDEQAQVFAGYCRILSSLAERLIYVTAISDRQSCCKLQPRTFGPSRHNPSLFPQPPEPAVTDLPSEHRQQPLGML